MSSPAAGAALRTAVLGLGLLFFSSCGYVGPVLPPSPEIPLPVSDLSAIERGAKIEIAFHTPGRTTDDIAIKRFSEVDLRAGPAFAPFDFETWSKTARAYPILRPPEIDPDDPQPVPVAASIPLEGLIGKHLAIAVRTSVKGGGGRQYSSWSNRVLLDVIPPLVAPVDIKANSSAEGVVLEWAAVNGASGYRILRKGANDKALVAVGSVEKAKFVDVASQFDVPYSYAVVATASGAESLVSQELNITPDDRFPPSIPAGITALAGPESVEISWQRSPEPDLAGYYVYRSVNDGAFERQGSLLALPAFSDRNVEHGKTYRYAIASLDRKNNESARSEPTEISF